MDTGKPAVKEFFVVVEYGGEWEDAWEKIIGVSSDYDVCKRHVNKLEQMLAKRHPDIGRDTDGWMIDTAPELF